MITRAILAGGTQAFLDRNVAGLPVLLRQALSLQDAGIDALCHGAIADRSPLQDARVRLSALSDEPPDVDGPALVVPAGCLWHPALVRHLVRLPVAPDEIVAVGSPQAAVYAAGARRVREVAAALSAGQAPPVSSYIEPRGREFVFLPRGEADLARAERLLLGSLYKPTDGIIARHLNRRASLPLSRRLLRFPISPNQMTFVAALFGLAAPLSAIRGGYTGFLMAAVLFKIQSLLDGCDGEIARLKHLSSRAGEWFDQVADDVVNGALMIAVGLALAREGHGYARALTIAAAVSQVVYVVALYAGLIVRGGGRGSVTAVRWWIDGPPRSESPATAGGRLAQRLVATFGDLTRRDFFGFLYLASALVGLIQVAFVWQCLITIGSALATTIQWLVFAGPRPQAAEARLPQTFAQAAGEGA